MRRRSDDSQGGKGVCPRRVRKESPGWKIYHVRAESMFPKEVDETSVDSPDGHPSDLGMMELADAYQQQIAAALGRKESE